MSFSMDNSEILEQIHSVDSKITQQRNKIQNDPDDLSDKLLKAVIPALAGIVIGQIATIAWNKIMPSSLAQGKRGRGRKTQNLTTSPEEVNVAVSIAAAAAFAAFSSALGSVASQLSQRGSQAIVDHKHSRKNMGKSRKKK